MKISRHITDRCKGRLAELVSVAEIQAALTDLSPSQGQTWVKVKNLGKRVKIVERDCIITGDIVWVVVRGDVATTVMIRREGQSIPADRVIGV